MIVLDTQAWVRWVDSLVNPLSAALVEKIESADALAVSAVSCWEVAWLHRRGRMPLKLPLEVWIEHALHGSEVACLPGGMPEHHRYRCRAPSLFSRSQPIFSSVRRIGRSVDSVMTGGLPVMLSHHARQQ